MSGFSGYLLQNFPHSNSKINHFQARARPLFTKSQADLPSSTVALTRTLSSFNISRETYKPYNSFYRKTWELTRHSLSSFPSNRQKRGERTMGIGDSILFIFFASHIPITLFLDGQYIIETYAGIKYPPIFHSVLDFHVKTNSDGIVAANEPWFQGLVLSELFLQLPFFFYAVHCIWNRSNSFRIPAIVYSSHVCTTLIPIFAQIWIGDNYLKYGLDTFQKKAILSLIYLPYLLIPLYLLIRSVSNEHLWTQGAGKKKGKKE